MALFASLPIPPYIEAERRELVRAVLDRIKDAHDSITSDDNDAYRPQY